MAEVALTTTADELGVAVAGRVATGVAEALELSFDRERRISVIIEEAAKNAAGHAYADREAGPLEVSLSIRDRLSTNGGPPVPKDVVVRVRDHGAGCPLPPTNADPPGLGLSVICGLADEFTLRSRRDGGTEIEAHLLDETPGPGPPERTGFQSTLRFDGEEFLSSVLPRAMAVYAVDRHAPLEQVMETMLIGDVIADGLGDDAAPPPVRISAAPEQDSLLVDVGPLPDPQAERVLAAAAPHLDDRGSARRVADLHGRRHGAASRVVVAVPLRPG